MTSDTWQANQKLASELRSLYVRVARRLGLDPYYVASAALGECRSKIVEDALEQELRRILSEVVGENATPRLAAAKRRPHPVPPSSIAARKPKVDRAG